MKPGDIFYIGPGHDSWVVGDQSYVFLHFLGAEKYAHDGEDRSRFEIICTALQMDECLRRMGPGRFSRTKHR